MASRTLDVTLNAKDNISAVFKKAGGEAKTFGETLEGLSSKGGGFKALTADVQKFDSEIRSVGAGLIAFGAAGTAAFGFATKGSINLESAMANVNSIAGLTTAQLGTMTDQVTELAAELGKSPQELADALYDIISSGVDASDAMQVLEKSTIAANAGLTDTATSARAITAVLNAYSLSADEAGNVSDLLFATVNEGVLTFEQLANNLSQVLPLAASLSIGLEEVSAAYAELTLQGFSAAQAETAIAAVMRSAINPTQELTDAVREYGYASVEALVQAEGLTGLLTVLQQASGGSSAALMELLGTAEATTGALALLSGGVDGFTARVDSMSAAATDGAYAFGVFQTQSDTTAFALQRLGSTFTAVQIEAGNALSGMVRQSAEFATGILNTFLELPEPIQQATAGVGAVASGLALMTGAAALAIPKVIELYTAIQTLAGTSVASAAALTGVWGAAITVATLGGVALGKTLFDVWESFQDGEPVIVRVSAALTSLSNGDVIGFFRQLAFGVDEATEAITDYDRALFQLYANASVQEALGNDQIAKNIQDMVVYTRSIEDNAAAQLENGEARARAFQEALSTGENVEKVYARVKEGLTLTPAEETARIQALDAIAAAYLDPAVNAEALRAEVDALNQSFFDGDINLDEHTKGLARIAAEYGHLPGQVSAAAGAIEEINSAADAGTATFTALTSTLEDYNAQLTDVAAAQREAAQNQATWEADAAAAAQEGQRKRQQAYDDDLAAMEARAEAQRQMRVDMAAVATEGAGGLRAVADAAREAERAFIADGLALAGLDDALSQINLTSLVTDASRLAENIGTAGDALDNTFRIIVDNTNAIAQQVQGVEDWALGLIGVQGEYGKIDDLLASGAITLDQYNAAQQAQIEISAANAQVQEDILAIQAQQAPLIADLTTQQAAYVEELSKQPQQQQLIALGWMDANTAAEANQAIMLASATAAGEYGEAGYAMTQQMIQGAVAANPVLGEMLEQMGLISVGADGTITVNFDSVEGATSEIERLNSTLVTLIDVLDDGEINGSVNIETDAALTAIDAVTAGVDAIDGTEAGLRVMGDNTDALAAIIAAESARDGVDGTTAQVSVLGDAGGAIGAVAAASAALGGIDGYTATTYITTISDVGGAVAAAFNSLASIDGYTATTYVRSVSLGSVGAAFGSYQQHGGLLSFASGGLVPFWGAEGNRAEVAHFAGGGTALLPREGLYAAPPMTVISPANANPGAGETRFIADFSNSSFYGTTRESMNEWFEQDAVPRLRKAITDRQRSYGEVPA